MALVDDAIDIISEARATAGALISSFEFRGQHIATSLENIDAAKSSIMPDDLTAEHSKLVSKQVLVKDADPADCQANQIPHSLYQLRLYDQAWPGRPAGRAPRSGRVTPE